MKVAIWPDGTWCYLYEACTVMAEHGKSDDYVEEELFNLDEDFYIGGE